MDKQIKLTRFETEELGHKIEVLIDSGQEMWDSCDCTELELETLNKKLIKGIVILTQKEYGLIKEEAEDALDMVESNYYAGFPEYKNDMIKLRNLVNKLESS